MLLLPKPRFKIVPQDNNQPEAFVGDGDSSRMADGIELLEETTLADKKKGPSLGKVFSLVALLTIAAKFAGLARDIVVLKEFGTSLTADAYNIAYILTGNILILFGGLGGPFHSATVAILTPRKEDKNIGILIGQVFAITFLVLLAIAALIFAFAPHLVTLIAPAAGHTAQYREDLWHETILQLQIMVPLIVIAGLVGISYGVLNVYGRFMWPSLSPAIASLSIIFAVYGLKSSIGGLSLAVGTLIGAFGQLLAQLPGTLKSAKLGFSLKAEPELAKYGAMLWPAVISTSVGQLNIYVDVFFISQLAEGSFTALVNANRLIQLILGVLLTAMLVPILPRFTEQVAANKVDDLKVELRRALRFLWFLALPAAALLLAIPEPIIQLLFQRGHFSRESTELVTIALIYLVPSIFFYVARDLMTRVFYAHHDSKTPYHVGLMAIFVHLVINWLLVGPMGLAGIALSTTLTTVFNFVMLSWLLRKKIGHVGTMKLIQPIVVMLLASAGCGASAWFSLALMPQDSLTGNWLGLLARLAVAGLCSSVAYLFICLICGLEEPILLAKRLKLVKAGK